ncbi:MAG: flagellar biosynthesis regulator FlaF [Alphaproteobacteria bacterium]|nr:flagellar biosynthesis regulator FlaF [Alphaproteobacteria bacterium]
MAGYDAYRRTQGATATQNARDLEYRLLAQVTGGLMEAESGRASLQDRLNAIMRNEKVWHAFLADLNHPDNGLSQSLKGNLASLALWVTRETKHVIDNDASLEDLIVINRQIMAGLKPEPMAMAG